MFHRTGGGIVDYDDFGPVIEHFIGIGNDDAILADVDATLDYLRGLGFADRQIGIVGFCFGGRVTFLVGVAARARRGGRLLRRRHRDRPLPAVPGARRPRDRTCRRRGSGCSATSTSRSRSTTSNSCATRSTDAPVDAEVVRYADAEHGFHCDARPSYNADAAADAWKRTLDWFARHLGAS